MARECRLALGKSRPSSSAPARVLSPSSPPPSTDVPMSTNVSSSPVVPSSPLVPSSPVVPSSSPPASPDKSSSLDKSDNSAKYATMDPAVFKAKVEKQMSRYQILDDRTFEQIVSSLVKHLSIPKSHFEPAVHHIRDFLAGRKKTQFFLSVFLAVLC